MTPINLTQFITEIKTAWGGFNSDTVRTCQSLLSQLANSKETQQSFIELLDGLATEKELYRDKENGFALLAHVEKKGQYRVPHDHGSGWVIYAVYSGEMEMATYSRHFSPIGEFSLVRRETYRMLPGECKVFLPADIHDTRCISRSVIMLRLTSCDLKKEEHDGRMIKYRDAVASAT